MADLLGIGTSALRSLQQALATTGHNISNVGTDGYSRQVVNFTTLPPQLRGSNYIGSGVTVDSINRVRDQFVEREIINYSASQGQFQAYSEMSARVDQLLANSNNNLTSALQGFFSSVNDVANNPTALPERQLMLGEAQTLVARQQSLFQSLSNLNLEVNRRLDATVNDINSLTSSIASLNENIVVASSSGQSPNDLLDQRDSLIRELSTKVGINTVKESNGSINVSASNGFGLVVGSEARLLRTATNPYDASKLDVELVSGGGTLNGVLQGGEMQGLLDFRNQTLDPAISRLGLLSQGVSEIINQQQGLGVDLDGNAGTELFSVGNLNAAASVKNTGSAVPTVALDDIDQLGDSNFKLGFDAGVWSLTRLSDGASTSGTGTLVLGGISVDTSTGSAADGDSFLIRPGHDAAAQFGAQLSDPRGIAAAAPLVSNNAVSNTGSLQLDQLTVTDAVDLPLASAITLTFNPDALGAGIPGFDVTGAVTTSLAYDPLTDAGGLTVSLGLSGASFVLSGVPDAGDVITLDNTGAGSGDNSNALAMAELQFEKLMQGGSSSFGDIYSGMVARVAIDTERAATGLELETGLLQQAEQYQDSISGVNLDEEAANLLKYQQQYQAAAQLVAIADTLFQTLLGATQR